MIKLLPSRGLGDAIMARAAVRYLLNNGERQITVISPWSGVFVGMPVKTENQWDPDEFGAPGIRLMPFVNPHGYATTHGDTFFEAHCRAAGIEGRVAFEIDWAVQNTALLDHVVSAAHGKPIMVYQPLKKIVHAYNDDITPDRKAFTRTLAAFHRYFRVKLGHPDYVEDGPDMACDLDLCGKLLNPTDVIDLGTVAEMAYGQHGVQIIVAEALGKEAMCMFKSGTRIDPKQMVSASTTRVIYDV